MSQHAARARDRRSNVPQLRLTAAAALATALAALTLWPVTTSHTWVQPSFLVIATVAVIGAGGRLLAAPRLLTLLAQIVGLVVFVTAKFSASDAFFGLVPTRASVRALSDLASSGASSINEQTVPVLDTPGIVLFIVLGVGLAALEVDFSAVACRCPAIAGIVLLAMYCVGVAVLPNGASWVWFAVAAAGWLLLLYVGRRESEHAWGGVLANVGGWVSGRSVNPRAALGQRIGVGAVIAGVLVAGVIPGLGDGVVGRFGAHDSGNGTGEGSGDAVKLDLTTTIQRSLLSKTNTPLFTYRTSDGTSQYLRLTVLDRFAGVAWKPAQLPPNAPIVAFGSQPVAGVDAPPGKRIPLVTNMTSLGETRDLKYVPAPYTPINVDGLSYDWRWDTTTSTIFTRSTELGAERFTINSEYVEPDAVTLAQQKGARSAPDDDRFTPPGVPISIGRSALTATAGATTDYAKAVQLQGWFRSNFHYSLDAPPTDSASAIDAFLTSKVGYCQQFAATYALMGRSLGLATRVVVGFAPGKANANGTYTVGTHDYHAWPEVWFDHVGWVRFEPTPRTGAGSTVDVPAWSLPNPLAPATIPTTAATASPGATPSSTARPTRSATADNATTSAASQSLSDRTRPLVAALLVLAVLALALTPGLARELRRRRRLSLPPGDDAVEAAWAELADTARDLGVPWADGDTPRRTADALVRNVPLDGSAAVAVQELRRDLEQTRYSGTPSGGASPEPAVRAVREQLLASTGRRERLQARFLPRTMLGRNRRR